MVHSRVFGFLGIALCFVACLCAHAKVSEQKAEEAVREVKGLTRNAVVKAEKEYKEAEYIKETMEDRKVKAVKAESEAGQAAKENEEAIAIANGAKSALEALNSIYPSAYEKAQKAVDVTKDLLSQAHVLVGRSKIPISPNGGSGNGYSEVSASAAEIKNETQELEEEIKKSKPLLDDARVVMYRVSDLASKAQIAKYRVDSIVTVAKIETLLSEAKTDVESIQQKKDNITAIVQEIGGHLNTPPRELMLLINRFHTRADSDLTTVTGLMKEVQTAQQAMLQEKTKADNALKEIPDLTDESKVRTACRDFEYFFNKAAEDLRKIKAAVKYADLYAQNSNKYKQDTLQALASHNSQPVTGKDKETSKPTQPVDDATTPTTTEDTKAPNDTKPSQPLRDTTTNVLSEGTKEQNDTPPGQQIEEATTTTTSEGTKEEKQTTKPRQPVEDTTKTTTTEDTKEKKDTNPSQLLRDTTTKTTSEGTKERKETNKPSQQIEDATTTTTSERTKEEKQRNKPSQQIEDATTKTTSEGTKEQNDTNPGQYVEKIMTTPGIKGKVTIYGADDDSATTASFSLLLALIVCAALN